MRIVDRHAIAQGWRQLQVSKGCNTTKHLSPRADFVEDFACFVVHVVELRGRTQSHTTTTTTTTPHAKMPAPLPRPAVLTLITLVSLLFLRTRFLPVHPQHKSEFPLLIAESLGTYGETDNHHHSSSSSSSSKFSPAEIYFDKTFSLTSSSDYNFRALRKQCTHTKWLKENGNGTVYLQCEGIYLGLTSVISQVKSCFKMAIEAGAGVILPNIPLRAANNLLAYNQGNHEAERPFGEWFDQEHLVESMQDACPGLNIITPLDIEQGRVEVQNEWSIDIHSARFFRERDGYFWAGKPFDAFFEENLRLLREEHQTDTSPQSDRADDREGLHNQLTRSTHSGTDAADLIGMRADLELFSVINDPTGHDRVFWDDLGRTLRFRPEPRMIVDKMLQQLGEGRPFFAVHFRGEGDNMWAPPEEQIRVDLDALDQAWKIYKHDEGVTYDGGAKPLVYLACGDEESIQTFVAAGKERGWNVTSKYALAKSMDTTDTFDMIEELPFDFQAIIDLGLLVKSYFFIGIMGSAFSYTVANLRDPTTRYRGSSFETWDDGGARTHLFPNNDKYGDTTMEKYACCL